MPYYNINLHVLKISLYTYIKYNNTSRYILGIVKVSNPILKKNVTLMLQCYNKNN